MTAQEIIAAHRHWKDHFRSTMATRQWLDTQTIHSDCCCAFGAWLYGDGLRDFGHLSEYLTCVEVHAAFHREAARIAELVNAGQIQEADRSLAAGTLFAQLSEQLGITVIALFRQVPEAGSRTMDEMSDIERFTPPLVQGMSTA